MREIERMAVRIQSEADEFGNDGGSYVERDKMRGGKFKLLFLFQYKSISDIILVFIEIQVNFF